ncbi:Caskin-2 [Varanus komodoensis]|nr:Caskin-2 [Varanus komodoensis]
MKFLPIPKIPLQLCKTEKKLWGGDRTCGGKATDVTCLSDLPKAHEPHPGISCLPGVGSLSAGVAMAVFDPKGSRGSDGSPSHLSPLQGGPPTTLAPAEEIWVLRKPYAGMKGVGGPPLGQLPRAWVGRTPGSGQAPSPAGLPGLPGWVAAPHMHFPISAWCWRWGAGWAAGWGDVPGVCSRLGFFGQSLWDAAPGALSPRVALEAGGHLACSSHYPSPLGMLAGADGRCGLRQPGGCKRFAQLRAFLAACLASHLPFLPSKSAGGDRSSVGSAGSVASGRSSGSGQSTGSGGHAALHPGSEGVKVSGTTCRPGRVPPSALGMRSSRPATGKALPKPYRLV